jgi:hypothetical protein
MAIARWLLIPAHTFSAGFIGPKKYLALKLLRIAAAVDRQLKISGKL